MKPIADFHVHTIASNHAFNTVEELARAARRKGLAYLAITDHGPGMPDGPHEYYFHNIKILPEKICGVRILKGVEANIISKDGCLDLEDPILRIMDIVIASSHAQVTPEKMSVQRNTKMLLKVIEKKYVDVLGHIENPLFPIKVREVVGAATEAGKIIEINNGSFTVARRGSYETCLEIIKHLKELKTDVMINSDAHHAALVGEITRAWNIAEEIGLKKENVINFSKKKVEHFLQQKRNTF